MAKTHDHWAEEDGDEKVGLAEAKAMIEAAEQKSQDEQRAADQKKYENALSRLPTRASATAELDFVRMHPAMSRKDRDGDTVVLKAKDIKDAPSVHAAQQLQHWANRPEEFYRQIMQLQRKRIESGEGDESAADDVPAEIARIDEMLALLECAVTDA